MSKEGVYVKDQSEEDIEFLLEHLLRLKPKSGQNHNPDFMHRIGG